MKSRSDIAAVAIMTVMGLPLSATASEAGHGNSVGAGLLGFGVGAIVGSALTPRDVYVVPLPPPPPPVYYTPAAWSPGWYNYCQGMYGPSFDPRTGYFRAADGGWYFCD
jgi:hypothetical protein